MASKSEARGHLVEAGETMSDAQRRIHWENVYQTKGERDVSWFQESPRLSLELHSIGRS